MGNEHEYALIGGLNRASIGRVLATIAAAISALLVFLLLSLVDFASRYELNPNIPPSIFSLIGAGAVYTALYVLFSRFIWKWDLVSKYLKVPDMTGNWHCKGQSSWQSDQEWSGRVAISQNWDKIFVVLETDGSRSESISAALLSEGTGGYRLLYHYRNDPRTINDELRAHHGFVDLVVDADLQRAQGVYFTGRGRVTHGTMVWERQ